MATTTSTAATAPSTKAAAPSADTANIQRIASLTENLINKYFPALQKAPNILYVMMAIMGAESSWKLVRNGTSAHSAYIGVNPTGAARRGYWNSSVIQNLLRRPNLTVAQKNAIYEGVVAHGLTGTMGYYYVKGCDNNRTGFGNYRKIVGDLSMEVEPATGIYSNLFAAQNDLALSRSIGSGLIILDTNYTRVLSSKTPRDALISAIGSYVGTGADANGTTASSRVNQVYSSNSIASALVRAGITQSGEAVYASAQGSGSGSDSSNNGSRTASTNGSPGATPGCSILG